MAIPAAALTIEDASRSPGWLKIYQYQKRTNGYQSRITADRFFFAPTGRHDPEAEMRAAVEAYQTGRVVGTQQQPAQCVFPARLEVLKKLLGREFPPHACPDLHDWIDRVAADEAHLVFVGAYAGNPASILGHTFVRLANSAREKTGREGMDLLSYSVGYQAVTDPNDNRAIYMYKGLTGGYDGYYEIEKHYIKVGIYNNSESRDLWDLKLNFTPAEVRFLVEHLWELTFNSKSPYFFIDENCSYRLLAFLEAARPDAHLVANTSTVVLPAETVRAVIAAGWAEPPPRFRSSIKRRMNVKIAKFSSEQRALFERARLSLHETQAAADPAVIDALLDYWLYENYRAHTQLAAERKAIMEATYSRAARLPKPPPPPKDSEIQSDQELEAPFLGHKPKWFSVAGGTARTGGLAALEYRSGVHPFWSSDRAYDDVASIEYLGADIEWRKGDLARWNLLLVDVKSLENYGGPDGHIAWTFATSAGNHCLICATDEVQGRMSAGAGAALKGPLTAYALAHLQTAIWDERGVQGLLAPGLTGGGRLRIGERWTWSAESGLHWAKKSRDIEIDSRLNFAAARNHSFFVRVGYEDLADTASDSSIRGGWTVFF